MTRWLLGLAMAALLASPAIAQMFCPRPDPPSCARFLMSSSQAWEFDDCRARIVRFQREVQDYAECQRQDREQLRQDLDDVIRRFNACARDRFC